MLIFFFWNSGVGIQRSFKGLLCSLLSQLLPADNAILSNTIQNNPFLLSKATPPLALQIYACWQKERGLAFLYYRDDRMGCVVVAIALQPASVMATTHIYLTSPKMSFEVIHGSTQERTQHPVNIHSTSTLSRSNGCQPFPLLSPSYQARKSQHPEAAPPLVSP